MEISEIEMHRLREKELEILRKFIAVCEKLELKYFIVQGTLLGAVRHSGFIPWDDDIDVGMLREDYEIFLEKGQELLPEGYFIQTHDTDVEYPHGFAKIRDSNTAFVETTCKNLHMNHGIYIDVFPFDYYPEGHLNEWKFRLKKTVLRYRIRSALYIPADKNFSLKNHVRLLLKGISKIIYPSLESALNAQTELYKSIKKGKKRANHGSPWGKREVIPKEWLENTLTLKFEDLTVKVPLNYDLYLKHVYGDYMKLPPLEEQVPHHYICAIDFDKPYIYNMINNTKKE